MTRSASAVDADDGHPPVCTPIGLGPSRPPVNRFS